MNYLCFTTEVYKKHCLLVRVIEVVFASGLCAKAPKMQICPKTFVYDRSDDLLVS